MHLFRLEQIAGLAIIVLVLSDVFLTVLYARVGTGILSARLARAEWRIWRWIAWRCGRQRGKVLSFLAPMILVLLVAMWAGLLALGSALVLQPALGIAVRSSAGPTPHDFMTALYAGASSLSFLGVGDFSPSTDRYRIFYMFGSLVGLSTMSLTLTYLMQIYSALRDRNTFGLKIHLLTAQSDDAAEMLAGFVAGGRLDATYGALAEVAAEAAKVKESHHFYPVLALFRFREPFYAMTAAACRCLDLVSLIKSALDDEAFGWVKESAAVTQLWRAALLTTGVLDEAQALGGDAKHGEQPDDETRERWRRRYHAAVQRLRQSGAKTYADEAVGAEIYASLRAEWEHRIVTLAQGMGYEMQEIDPAGVQPAVTAKLPDFRRRLTAVE